MGEGMVSEYTIKAMITWCGGGWVELHKGADVLSRAEITEMQLLKLSDRAGYGNMATLYFWRLAIDAVPDAEERGRIRRELMWNDDKQALSETIR